MTAELFLQEVGTIYNVFFDKNFYQPSIPGSQGAKQSQSE